jgi:uncharacterized membrane protein
MEVEDERQGKADLINLCDVVILQASAEYSRFCLIHRQELYPHIQAVLRLATGESLGDDAKLRSF